MRLAPIYGGVSLIAGNYTSARILIARLLQEVARLFQEVARLFQEVARLFQEESGSAVLEFIMVALPLFLPLAIFLQSVEAKSQGLGDLNNVARQVARAFTTSPSEELAPVRANEVLMTYQNEFHLSRGGHSTLTLSINCQMQPCLTPNAKVTVTLTESDLGLSASASQIVDAWRSTG